MNLIALAPTWAILLLAALLVIAAIQDAIQLKISSLTCIAVLLVALVVAASSGFRVPIWQNLLLLVAALTAGTFLFSAGKLGGGDVKLFASTVFWFDLQTSLWLLVSVTISGGVLAMVILTLRSVGWSEEMQQRAVILRRRGGIPYGVAIAAGALFLVSLTGSQNPVDPRKNWSGIPIGK
jgi:prepilin peptidase CpaA